MLGVFQNVNKVQGWITETSESGKIKIFRISKKISVQELKVAIGDDNVLSS